jgi:hypothetical protein
LSSQKGAAEVLHDYYTIYPDTGLHPYHTEVVRTKLSRMIGVHFAELHEELEYVVPKQIPLTEGMFAFGTC